MNKNTLSRPAFVMALFITALLCTGQAARGDTDDKYSMDINMSGTVVANGSCSFDQNGTLRVDFNEIKLKGTGNNTVELDGAYIMPLISSFSCSGDTAGLLQMKFMSSTGSYLTYSGTQVLDTGTGVVGIELLVDGTAQNMGEWFTVDQDNQPKLQAQLVQVSNTNDRHLTSGTTFTASATLMLAFN